MQQAAASAAASAFVVEQQLSLLRGDHPLLHCCGRSIVAATGARSFDFPGFSVAAQFRGATSVKAVLEESGTNRFGVSLDGGSSWLPDTLNTTADQNVYTVCAGLSPEVTYDLVLLKLTEACSRVYGCTWGDFGTTKLLQLHLEGRHATALAPVTPWAHAAESCAHRDATTRAHPPAIGGSSPLVPRRLEFIGDSITAATNLVLPPQTLTLHPNPKT